MLELSKNLCKNGDTMLNHVKRCADCIELCKKLIDACKECDYKNKTTSTLHQHCVTACKKFIEGATECLKELEMHQTDCTNEECLASCHEAATASKECIKACQECAIVCKTTGTDCSHACYEVIRAAHECIKACNKAINHACE